MGLITTITTNHEAAKALENHIKRENNNGVSRSYLLQEIKYEKNYAVIVLIPSHNYTKIDDTDIFFLGYYTCLNS